MTEYLTPWQDAGYASAMHKCPYRGCGQTYPTQDELDEHVMAGHRDERLPE